MLIDIGNDVLAQEGLHPGSLLAVVLDRGGVEPSFVTAFVADFTGMLDIVYRLVEEPRRNPDDFLEVFFVRAGSAELEAVQASLHALFDYVRVGEATVGGQEHVWRFKVFFKPPDGGYQALGIDKALTDIKRSDLDDASIAHFERDTLKELPINVLCRILPKLQRTERTAIIAALCKFDLDRSWRGRSDL